MKPYLFLHIPRTGGTSIANILPAGRTTNAEINKLISDGFKNNHGVSLQHAILDDYPVSTNELFKFTFVRNPWDRVVSIFEHQVKSCSTKFALYNLTTGEVERPYTSTEEKFSAFITKVKKTWEDNTINSSWDGHFTPQISYTHDNQKNKIVDYIGHFETLEQDIKNLNDLCGWGLKNIDIPHTHNSLKKNYRCYYNQGNGLAKEIIYQLYRDEIEFFGYKF